MSEVKVRKLKVDNCAGCKFRAIDEHDSWMECTKRVVDAAPWGDEIEIHYTVCDYFKASKG